MAQKTADGNDVDPNPFDDIELDADDILGTRTFEGVLFSEDTAERPVNVLTGEPPEHSRGTVEDAKQFAAEASVNSLTGKRGTPKVAKPQSVEAQVETQSAPYVASAFYHMDLTSRPLHFAYNRAFRSAQYHVAFNADYQSGDLTIRVVEAQ